MESFRSSASVRHESRAMRAPPTRYAIPSGSQRQGEGSAGTHWSTAPAAMAAPTTSVTRR